MSTGIIYRKRIAICRNVIPEILRKVNAFQNVSSFGVTLGNFLAMERAFSDGKQNFFLPHSPSEKKISVIIQPQVLPPSFHEPLKACCLECPRNQPEVRHEK